MKDKTQTPRADRPRLEPVNDAEPPATAASKLGDLGRGSREETQGGSPQRR